MDDGALGLRRWLAETYTALKNVKRTLAMEANAPGPLGRLPKAYRILRTLQAGKPRADNALDICGRLLAMAPEGTTFVDSACGHGRYAVLARDTGRFSRVVGFDARSDRVPVHEGGIEWKLSRIEDWDYSGFDVVLLSGILYHLDPARQVKVMHAISIAKPSFVIINTHHVLSDGMAVSSQPFRNKLDDGISQVEIGDGLGGTLIMSGAHFNEGGNLKNRPLAAYENASSFWHTADSLTAMMRHYGFALRQTSEPVVFQNLEYANRNFFLFVKD